MMRYCRAHAAAIMLRDSCRRFFDAIRFALRHTTRYGTTANTSLRLKAPLRYLIREAYIRRYTMGCRATLMLMLMAYAYAADASAIAAAPAFTIR